ncbi:hypothetical protein DM860_008875 [Cuscuta australis]|uniref:Aminotransferase-like plant mobile domain-containing protein n=1 Tax=Cuscuta australis TaxID=267555 RepID=A0A328DCS2_9ASTE|nr:hypothetical protein DM860_008875 [Cuscuta australis]
MDDMEREREMERDIAGPRIDDMLHLQNTHRSSRVWKNSSGRFAPTDFVSYLRDFDTIANFSWGSAILTRLFSGLCRASLRVNNARPCGCILLLQLWAWARITTICPDVHSLPRHRHDDYVPGSDPHGARWRMSKEYSRTAQQNVRYFRDQFDGLLERHILWQPYNVQVLPEYCSRGIAFWSF